MEGLRDFFYAAVDKACNKETRKIYIIENEKNEKVGHLYILPKGDEYDLPCAILSNFCGRGYAKQAIKLGLEEGRRLGFKKMVGSIREDNIASMKAYTACGIKILDKYKDVFIPKLGKKVKMYTAIYNYEDD